jgi:F-type H+-transporting ATPase subunit c
MSRIFNFVNFLFLTLLSVPAFAADPKNFENPNFAIPAFAAAFAISVAAFGGAIAQGRAAAAALEGIARNPGASKDIFLPMIISLALIESLVIYALLIAFSIIG